MSSSNLNSFSQPRGNLLNDAPESLRLQAPEAFAYLVRVDAASEVHRVEFEPGRHIVWRRFGSGPPLLLLHGGHGSWMHWIRNIDALSKQHTLWIPDLPGGGESDMPEGDPGLPEIANILIRTIDALIGAEQAFDVAGFSFGGLAAAHVAAQRKHVERMVMVGPGGHGSPRRQSIPMLDWRLATDPIQEAAMQRNNMHSLLFFDPSRMDDVALVLHTLSCHAARLRSKKLASRGELPAALGKVTARTLVVWGEEDVTAYPEVAGPKLVAASTHAHCEWRVVPDAGHMAQYEAADAINSILKDWFDPAQFQSRK